MEIKLKGINMYPSVTRHLLYVCVMFIILWIGLPTHVSAQYPITPPPNLNNRPVVANGRIYYLNHIPAKCREPAPIIMKLPSGGIIKENRALVKADNPHIVLGHIEIAPTGCLYIEPGTILKFGPGVGIIVNGTLIARGSEEPGGRIIMTKANGEDTGKPSGDWQDDARLSMGNTTRDGRLDLKYKDRWRAVCTNYNNYTAIDANVTCRHLGFLKGNFTYHSYARNLTDYVLWERPNCLGSENSLFDCPGANTMKTGRHICDGQEVIGFECEGLRPGLASDHWRGVDFYNSTTEKRWKEDSQNMMYLEESLSFLEYLDISYTGLDLNHGQSSVPGVYYQKAAISASPHVPLMNNVTVRYGAYDGLNATMIMGSIHIANSTFSHNRGYGLFIQSSVGRTLVNNSEIAHNWGDGIKFYISNVTIFDFRTKYPPKKSFCVLTDAKGQAFPFFRSMDLIQVNGDERTSEAIGGYCERTYETKLGMRITVHFLIMERDPAARGTFQLRDGGRYGTLTNVDIYNGSFPQSYTTHSNVLHVRFNYTRPRDRICNDFPPCIRFLIELTTDYDVDEEFRLLMSSVHNNIGYGVNVQDLRSKMRISNGTVISDNGFGAGLRVYQGAGDIIVNGTKIERNADAGVNITYSGGYQLFNDTSFNENKGYGMITEYIKFNRTRIEKENKIEIVRVNFTWNDLIGLRMGNYCMGGNIKVNDSLFAYNWDEAFEYLSCNISTMFKTELIMEFNNFVNNFRHAILLRPLLNTKGLITNNTFTNHNLGVIRIDNGYDLLISRWYRDFPVDMDLFENTFTGNTGRYVLNFRASEYSAVQRIHVKFNRFENNVFNDSFPYLNPRSRANAVVVLSSSNVLFQRNHLYNPDSLREIATHLVDPSIVIDATENYWGQVVDTQEDYKRIYMAVFDQNARYNLAKIKYFPALLTSRLYDDQLADKVPEYIWPFMRPGNVIGGAMEDRRVTIRRGQTFYVDRDIYIFKRNTLHLEPGSTLKFAPSVGMVVHGILQADGMSTDTPVRFRLDDSEEFVPMENRTATVRLMGGLDPYEGRLEVELNGQWGTVCNHGWIEENALLACQQLGLIYNRDFPTARVQSRASSGTPILMNWVACEEVDVDITQCHAVNEDTKSCDHSHDVYLRCQPPTWAGITLAAARKRDQEQPVLDQTQIRYAEILNAGLLDPDTGTLTPALRIDYNFYQISWLRVERSISDAISVVYNHPYTENLMEYLRINHNAGNGVVTKSPKLLVRHSIMDQNDKAGFKYDPFYTEYDALLTRNMIYPDRRVYMFDPRLKTGEVYYVRLTDLSDHIFLLCQAATKVEKKVYYVQISTERPSYIMSLQLMDYQPDTLSEKVIIYDTDVFNMNGQGVTTWEIEQDLVDFPILSSGSSVTIKVSVNGQLSGRLAFVVIPRQLNSDPPDLRTELLNTTFTNNDQGIVTNHYNNPSNQRMEIFHRHKEETIHFQEIQIYRSTRHAMHMPSVTKFHEDYIPTYEDMTRPERVATIKYTIFQSLITDNFMGILAEHNHVDFANNVWQWTINEMRLRNNKKGGLEIEVPRVNDESERQKHAVTVIESRFTNNMDFVFSIAGYYADVAIKNNQFTNNICRLGLISITGMEKSFNMTRNDIKDNTGRYVLDMNILSHSEYGANVRGTITYNVITGNRPEQLFTQDTELIPKTYTISLKGLEDIGGYRNLFDNKEMRYELVGGIEALRLASHINFTHNYWGYTDESVIRKRIFDFDEWNNYVIVDYWPYLTKAEMFAFPSTGSPAEIFLDPSHLGGRVERSQALTDIGQPYIVQSDLTVMPGVTLTIPIGTELQFRPNVGILVLGRLVANGLPHGRIKMRPLQPAVQPFPTMGRKKREVPQTLTKRQAPASATIRLRGDGTLFKDAGFLELYNSSSKSWNLMCDNQFNEETAEVVCRELGKETINVKVRFTELYDYHIYGKPMYFLKEFWFNKYHCRGDESRLDQCTTRYNYNLMPCIIAANYTFITCGERNLDPSLEYWGNIRFAQQDFEEKPLEADIGRDQSIMNYVDIEGAGMLHGRRVGAIQTTYVTPEFGNINITNSADNGFDIVAPRQDLRLERQNITGNLGFGINVLVLNGESSDRRSSFLPNGPSTIPYNLYGLVDICTMEKEINLETRMILYYKYGPYERDCVKIVSSRKHIGMRFLQINLFQEDFSRNMVEIFDGKEIRDSTLLARVMSNSSQEEIQRLYQSTGTTMSIHIHASVAHKSYGFVAEVVRLPPTGLTYPNSEISHTLEQSEIRNNQDGAIQYKSVGETTPSLFIEHCWITNNGYPILNLTSPPSIDLSLQSMITMRFSHNQVSYNKGGMYLFAHTSAINTALRGNMTNNVFAFGTHGEALNISGHYFERLMLHQNYIYNYTAGDYRDVIHIKNVVVNLTSNYILRNTGHYIFNLYASDDSTESQLFARNGIYDNNATALREATVKVSSGHPKLTYNYLVNVLNDFEIESYPINMSLGLPINAKGNWWGSERRAYISGKTLDYYDDKALVEINFWPPILDNRSMIEGDCLPGWVLNKNRCYRYMGGALPYQDAKDFCISHGAFLAEARGREGFFNYLIRLMVIEPDWTQRVWVMSDVGADHCSAFEQDYIVREEDCARKFYPFICETDPYVDLPEELAASIRLMIIGICVGVGGIILIIVVVVIILWCIKSKRREKERFERTASIRSSLNNLNKINSSLRGTKSTLTMMSDGYSRRRLNELDERSVSSSYAKHSQSSAMSNGVNGSITSIHSDEDVERNQIVYPTVQRAENARPTHSLRPDRSGARARIQSRDEDSEREQRMREREERERERTRQLQREREERERRRRRREPSPEEEEEEERGKMDDDSSDSDVKKGLNDDNDDEYVTDSSFDDDDDENESSRDPAEKRGIDNDDIDARNLHYRINRSNEHLLQKPPLAEAIAAKARAGLKPTTKRAGSKDNLYDGERLRDKSSSMPSFMQPEGAMGRPDLLPLRSGSRENLPTPHPDPRRLQSSPDLADQQPRLAPRPAPRPKPIPPVRTPDARPSPRSRSQELLYNNEPPSRRPLEDDRSSQSSKPKYYNIGNGSDIGSHRGPLYDPVYDGQNSQTSSQAYRYDPVYEGSTSSRSRSTDRYEPMEYGHDQGPDTDYMPRPVDHSAALSRSRDRLGLPPPLPPSQPPQPSLNQPPMFRAPLDSDLDSYSPSIQSDVDYLPRKLPLSSTSSRFDDSLPLKSGASPIPEVQPFRGSRDRLDSFPQPPPYPGDERNPRSGSRDRINLTGVEGGRNFRGSRDRLDDQPPPYSPGDERMPRQNRGGRGDTLYLGGARPKHEHVETEI